MLLDNMRMKVFEWFLEDYDIRLTGSQIAKEKMLNQKSVSNVLIEYEKENILKSVTQGRNKLYYLNFDNKEIVKNFILSVENLRTIEFLKKNTLVKEISSKIYKFIKGSAVIFGSYAKNTQKKDSDVDLLIIGKVNEKEIDKISEIYKIDINLKVYPNINKIDTLIKEVIKNHIIIKDGETFILNILKVNHGSN